MLGKSWARENVWELCCQSLTAFWATRTCTWTVKTKTPQKKPFSNNAGFRECASRVHYLNSRRVESIWALCLTLFWRWCRDVGGWISDCFTTVQGYQQREARINLKCKKFILTITILEGFHFFCMYNWYPNTQRPHFARPSWRFKSIQFVSFINCFKIHASLAQKPSSRFGNNF